MISRGDLRRLAQARLRDAEVLFASGRHDGAAYLCGYAIELVLKARICRQLKWAGFPETRREFEGFQSFRTHNLDVLLRLTGLEAKVKSAHVAEWSIVATWEPEVRYRPVGSITRQDARDMIDATRHLLGVVR